MPDINEKNILDGIKHSIENETPDIWENIKNVEKCKYDMDKKTLNLKMKRTRWAAAAIAACAIIASVGLGMRIINTSGYNNLLADNGRQTGKTGEIIAPGVPETGTPSDSAAGSCEIFDPFEKDADVDEAARALNIDIMTPTWLPDGFTKFSSKLFSYKEDGSEPFMFNVQYSSPSVKVFTLSVTKNITEEEKIKSQPDSAPESGVENAPVKGVPETGVAVPPVPPDYTSQSEPGYNPSEPVSSPPKDAAPSYTSNATDTPVSSGTGSGSTGSAVTPVSVEVIRDKINNIDVEIVVTSESKAISAFWVYNGGSYNISTDGISRNDMTKIIESMIR